MEIQQLEPQVENMQEEYEKAQKFKEYVQGIFIENNSQEEFKRRVDAISVSYTHLRAHET